MGTVTAQQVTGWIGVFVVAVVAVVGLTGPSTIPASVATAKEAPAPAAAELDSLVSLLPTVREVAGLEAVHAHDVVPGDTLSGIASANGTTVDALAEHNGLAVDQPLQIGQVLLIPTQPEG